MGGSSDLLLQLSTKLGAWEKGRWPSRLAAVGSPPKIFPWANSISATSCRIVGLRLATEPELNTTSSKFVAVPCLGCATGKFKIYPESILEFYRWG